MIDDALSEEAERLAGSLEDEREAEALLTLFEIVSEADYAPEDRDVYTPFVYPH